MGAILVIIWFCLLLFAWCLWPTECKKQKKLQGLIDEMKCILKNVRRGDITKSSNGRILDLADEALLLIADMAKCRQIKPKEKETKEKEVDDICKETSMLMVTRTSTASLGEEIDKLATLRQNGMISDLEFKAFSERFKLSTGEKASGIIKAISELSEQHRKGVMSESNYHAALWSLLDKIDRKI